MRWTNRATLVAFKEAVYYAGEERPDVIREGREEASEDFLDAYAEQLREDFAENHNHGPRQPDAQFRQLACRMLLARVDWKQVAERLVARAQTMTNEPAAVQLFASRGESCQFRIGF